MYSDNEDHHEVSRIKEREVRCPKDLLIVMYGKSDAEIHEAESSRERSLRELKKEFNTACQVEWKQRFSFDIIMKTLIAASYIMFGIGIFIFSSGLNLLVKQYDTNIIVVAVLLFLLTSILWVSVLFILRYILYKLHDKERIQHYENIAGSYLDRYLEIMNHQKIDI